MSKADALRRAERYLESLVLARPRPHYVVAPKGTARPAPAFGLARLGALLDRMGRPQDQLRFVHIAGTSGKTSTATLAAAISEAHGLRTGLHISPHMASVCERLTIDRAPCDAAALASLIDEVKPDLDQLYRDRTHGMVSYFELVLALALRHFARNGVELTILEAGLGGRYDGSNIIPASAASVLTNVGLDHTHILGSTRAEIARDKLGILKPPTPIITAEQDPEVFAIIAEEGRRLGAPVLRLGRDFEVETLSSGAGGCRFHYRSPTLSLRDCEVRAPGRFQALNAALALRAVELAFEPAGRRLDPERCRSALAQAKIPGRLELVEQRPPLLLDAAHNADKLAQLARELRELEPDRRFVFVFAATTGRELAELLAPLLPLAEALYLTRPMASYRSGEEPAMLADAARALAPSLEIETFLDPCCALVAARRRADPDAHAICVTGSLFLVSYLRAELTPKLEEPSHAQ